MYNTEKEFSKVVFLHFPSNFVALPLLEMLATKVDLPSSCLFFTSLKISADRSSALSGGQISLFSAYCGGLSPGGRCCRRRKLPLHLPWMNTVHAVRPFTKTQAAGQSQLYISCTRTVYIQQKILRLICRTVVSSAAITPRVPEPT